MGFINERPESIFPSFLSSFFPSFPSFLPSFLFLSFPCLWIRSPNLLLYFCDYKPTESIYSFDMDPNWSETGDRYLLKLFRDYVFHQVDENGSPFVNLAHVIQTLNKVLGFSSSSSSPSSFIYLFQRLNFRSLVFENINK